MSSKIAVVAKECVACGNCVKFCPKGAISVHKGMCAVVDVQNCVGCGKCAEFCPAAVISISSPGGLKNEKAVV